MSNSNSYDHEVTPQVNVRMNVGWGLVIGGLVVRNADNADLLCKNADSSGFYLVGGLLDGFYPPE